MTQDEEQLLVSVFRLGEGYFGVPAAQIQEVVQLGTLTSVHHAPACVLGIRNLRGRIVTVIDLKRILGLGAADLGSDARIMMLDRDSELLGLIVEAMEDTIFLDTAADCFAASLVDGIDPDSLRGIYRVNDRLIALLDHEAILKPKSTANSSGKVQ